MKVALKLAVLGLILSMVSGCSRTVVVKIGVVAPMSGSLAQYGKDMANGAQTAVDEMNANKFSIGGKQAKFELVVEDDKASPEEGKLAAKRLVDAGVVAIFGHFNSGVSIAAAPIYAAAGIPQLSVSTNPKYTRMNLKTTFRITADDIQQGATIGKLISEQLRAKSIYTLDDKTTFGIGLVEEVSKILNARNMSAPHHSIDPNAADYPEIANTIIGSKADVVFFGGDEGVGLPLLSALRKAGSNAKFVAADAMCAPSTVKNAKGTADAYFYCTVAGVPPSWLSAGIDFTQQYKAKFGQPGPYATLSYDGIHVLAQAMQEAQSSDPEKYLPTLAKGSFNGKIQGPVEFDSKGDLKDGGTVVIYQSISGVLTEQRDFL